MYRYADIIADDNDRGVFLPDNAERRFESLLHDYAHLRRVIREGNVHAIRFRIGAQLRGLVLLTRSTQISMNWDLSEWRLDTWYFQPTDPTSHLLQMYAHIADLDWCGPVYYVMAVYVLTYIAKQHGLTLEECIDDCLPAPRP